VNKRVKGIIFILSFLMMHSASPFLLVWGTNEDFENGWTEQNDTGNKITVLNSTHVHFDGDFRTPSNLFLLKDDNGDYSDFTYYLDININASSSHTEQNKFVIIGWSQSELAQEDTQTASENGIFVGATSDNSADWGIRVFDTSGGSSVNTLLNTTHDLLTLDTWYYLKFVRSNDQFTVYIYDDIDFTSLFYNQTITLSGDYANLDEMQICSCHEDATATDMEGVIAYLRDTESRSGAEDTTPELMSVGYNQSEANKPTLMYSQWNDSDVYNLTFGQLFWDVSGDYMQVDNVSISGGWANFTETIPLSVAGSSLHFKIQAQNTNSEATNTSIQTITVPSISPSSDLVGRNSSSILVNTLYYSLWSSSGGASLNESTGKFYWNESGSFVGESVTYDSGWLNISKYISGGFDGKVLGYYFTIDNEYGNTTISETQTYTIPSLSPVEINISTNNTIYKIPTEFQVTWTCPYEITSSTLYTNLTGSWANEEANLEKLSYFPPSFSKLTEVDPDANFSITDDRVTFSNLKRRGTGYNYMLNESIGSGDFTLDFSFRITDLDYGDGTQVFYMGLVSIMDGYGTHEGLDTTLENGCELLLHQKPDDDDTQFRLYFREHDRGITTNDYTGNLDVNTTYYVRIWRDDGNLKAKVFTDSSFSTPIESLATLNYAIDDVYVDLNYIQVGYAINDTSTNPDSMASGWIQRESGGLEDNYRTRYTFTPDYTHAGQKTAFYFTATNSLGNISTSSTHIFDFMKRENFSVSVDHWSEWDTVNPIIETDRDWLFWSPVSGYYHLFFVDADSINEDLFHIISYDGIRWEYKHTTQLFDVTNDHEQWDFDYWYDSSNNITYFDALYTTTGGSNEQRRIWWARYREYENGSIVRLDNSLVWDNLNTFPLPPENEDYIYGEVRSLDLSTSSDGYPVAKWTFLEAGDLNPVLYIAVGDSKNGNWVNHTFSTFADIDEWGMVKADDRNNILYIGNWRTSPSGNRQPYLLTMHTTNAGSSWSSFENMTTVTDSGYLGLPIPRMLVVDGAYYFAPWTDDPPDDIYLHRIDPDNSWRVETLGFIKSIADDERDVYMIHDPDYDRILLGYDSNAYRWFYLNNDTLSDEYTDLYFHDTSSRGGSYHTSLETYEDNPTRMIVGVVDDGLANSTFWEFNPLGIPLDLNDDPTVSNMRFTNLNDGTFIILGVDKTYNLRLSAVDTDGGSTISTQYFALRFGDSNVWINCTVHTGNSSIIITSGGDFISIEGVSVSSGSTSQLVDIGIRFNPSTPLDTLNGWLNIEDSGGSSSGWFEFSDLASFVVYEEGGGGGSGSSSRGFEPPPVEDDEISDFEPEEQFLIQIGDLNLIPIPSDWTRAQRYTALFILWILLLLILGAIAKRLNDSVKVRRRKKRNEMDFTLFRFK